MAAVVGFEVVPNTQTIVFRRHVLGQQGGDWELRIDTDSDEKDPRYYRIYAAGNNTYVLAPDEYQTTGTIHIVKDGEVFNLARSLDLRQQHVTEPNVFLFAQTHVDDDEDPNSVTLQVMRIGDTVDLLQESKRVNGTAEYQMPGWFPFAATDIGTTSETKIGWVFDDMSEAKRPAGALSAADLFKYPNTSLRRTPYGWYANWSDDQYDDHRSTTEYLGYDPKTFKTRLEQIHEGKIRPIGEGVFPVLTEAIGSTYETVLATDGRESELLPDWVVSLTQADVDDVDVMLAKPVEVRDMLADAMGSDLAGYMLGFYLPSPF